MFDNIFELFSAFTHLSYLIAGGTVSGIGVLILAYAIWRRMTEQRYTGEIVGDRKEGDKSAMFWPVVSYTDTKGERHEVTANTGSSTIGGGSEPGARVTVLASGSGDTMLARDWWILVGIGAFMTGIGYPFLSIGLHGLKFNWATAIVAIALSAHLSIKAIGFVHRIVEARRTGDFEKHRVEFLQRQQDRTSLPLASRGEIDAAVTTQKKNMAALLPVALIGGLVLFAGAAFWLQQELRFLSSAVEAKGTVVDIVASDDGKTYHAVARFIDRAGIAHEFRDSVGASPPSYDMGETVGVLYAPTAPSSAAIDRGIWNWLVPLLAMLAGAALFGGGAYGYARRRLSPDPVALKAAQ